MNYLSRSSPIVTVGIPSYNAGPHLRAAVDSVQSQTFADWELYISDDSSTDASVDFLGELVMKDRRIHFVRNRTRLGLPGNFTQCARFGTGQYVTIFHQDDVMLPENLARKVQVLASDLTVGLVLWEGGVGHVTVVVMIVRVHQGGSTLLPVFRCYGVALVMWRPAAVPGGSRSLASGDAP